jgi:hypothetical protein
VTKVCQCFFPDIEQAAAVQKNLLEPDGEAAGRAAAVLDPLFWKLRNSVGANYKWTRES